MILIVVNIRNVVAEYAELDPSKFQLCITSQKLNNDTVPMEYVLDVFNGTTLQEDGELGWTRMTAYRELADADTRA